jgi:MarR family 2-MHQ and catechol resistance regulon transcriptional repressor
MTPLERKARDLRDVIQDIMQQFRVVDGAFAHGPHAELSLQELRVVEYLGDSGPRIMSELADFLLLAVNSVTSIVDNLETRGLARRQRSEHDRRKVQVELTERGRKLYAEAVEAKLQCFRAMLGALTTEEQDIYLVLMRKIARAGRSQVDSIGTSA